MEKPTLTPCRIQYFGALCSFHGPEDEYEAWRARPRVRLLLRVERWVPAIVAGALASGLLGMIFLRAFS